MVARVSPPAAAGGQRASGTFSGGHPSRGREPCTLPAMSYAGANRGQPLRDTLDAFDAASRAIAGLQPVDQVLQVIVDRVRPLVGAHYAAIGILGRQGRIEQFVTSGIDTATRARLGDPPTGHGLLGLIIREARSLRIPVIAAHPASVGFPPGHPPMTSLIGVPVRAGGRTVGNLYLTDKIGATEFSEEDERLVEAFAAHAGIAIENARLHAQVRGLTVVEERERISRDLHDGIIQSLYGIGLQLEDVPDLMDDDPPEATVRVERAIDALHVAIRDLRTFVFGLRPELISSPSLVGGLATLAEAFRHNTLIEPVIQAPPNLPEPPREVADELLAIGGEALSNIARHARASAVTIDVSPGPGGNELILTVTDNGVGLPDPDRRHPGHHGLANMQERASAVGGELAIESAPGRGTTISVRVPAGAGLE
jgi:signal transduction histidine kinase